MSNGQSNNCQQCGAPIDGSGSTCRFCGAEISMQPQYQAPQYAPTNTQQSAPQYAQQNNQQNTPQYAQQNQTEPRYNDASYSSKNKIVAGILALILGGFGAHKFYLGKPIVGIIYLLLCWTYIPSFIGFIEGIIYLTSSDEKFYIKYVKK